MIQRAEYVAIINNFTEATHQRSCPEIAPRVRETLGAVAVAVLYRTPRTVRPSL